MEERPVTAPSLLDSPIAHGQAESYTEDTTLLWSRNQPQQGAEITAAGCCEGCIFAYLDRI
jgi:hypothetical protein